MRRSALAGFLAVFTAYPVIAFDCVPVVDQVDVVFKGRVRKVLGVAYVVQDENKRLPDQVARFEVLETYKGEAQNGFQLYFYSMSPEGTQFTAGDEVWVYAKRDKMTGNFVDDSCGITRAPEDLAK